MLKTKLKALQAELDNTNRNLTRAVAENESHQNDATELAALREALYNMQYTGSDETSVEASSRELPNNVISVGGSQQWLTAMRDALPEVKFYSPDQLIPDSVIRSASEAWLNASAMSHSQFYAVISVVRKYNVPLHYYSHRGTVGCISDLLAN